MYLPRQDTTEITHASIQIASNLQVLKDVFYSVLPVRRESSLTAHLPLPPPRRPLKKVKNTLKTRHCVNFALSRKGLCVIVMQKVRVVVLSYFSA